MNLNPDWLWLEEASEMPIPEMVRHLGLHSKGNRCWPCPACNEETAGSKDRRKGPISFNDVGWRCHRCKMGGGALGLAAWVLLGEAKPAEGDKEGWAKFAEAYTGRAPKVYDLDEHRKLSVRAGSSGPINEPTNPRPDIRELKKLWAACIPVTEDAEVSAWLKGRGLNPLHIARGDLARALPESAFCPRWASFMGQRWKHSGHRLIFRAVGPSPSPSSSGWAWSLRARNILPGIPSHQKSASAACGCGSATGLVYADEHARRMLMGSLPCKMIITEGEPDWLVWSSRMCELHPRYRWGVLGIWNGSWTDEIASHFHRGSTVALRTHRDKAGASYADKIEGSLLPQGVTVYRLVGNGPDENDSLQAHQLDIEPLHGCVHRELRGRVG